MIGNGNGYFLIADIFPQRLALNFTDLTQSFSNQFISIPGGLQSGGRFPRYYRPAWCRCDILGVAIKQINK